ncbi:MAG: hypothetical protein RLZZ387_5463 [Chloroflexota bacterium]
MDIKHLLHTVTLEVGPVQYIRTGDGPPLVLLHGWGGSSRYWLPTLAALADTRTMYALDFPGFNGTQALSTPATAERLAEVVLEFAEVEGLTQFDLAAHSFGASVAALVAARAPEQVRRVVLVSFGLLADEMGRSLLELLQRPAALGLSLWYPWLNITAPILNSVQPVMAGVMSASPLPQLLSAWFLEQAPAEQALIHEGLSDLASMDLRAHLACLASVGDPAITAGLSAISAPTLLITGRQDRVAPPDTSAAVAGLLPQAKAEVLERCGHVPMFEQPEAFHAMVREFLCREA